MLKQQQNINACFNNMLSFYNNKYWVKIFILSLINSLEKHHFENDGKCSTQFIFLYNLF